MANEIKSTLSVTIVNGEFKDQISESDSITQNAQGAGGGIVGVTTSEGDLSVGGVTTNGYLFIKNLDSTNFISYGPKSAGVMVAFGKLLAGEWAWIRIKSGVTIRAIADTATCKISYTLYQD